MRGVRLYSWSADRHYAVGLVGAVRVYVVLQHIPNENAPGIASVYLQCIAKPNAKRRECKARAEWFGDEPQLEFRAGWPWIALGLILVV